MARPILIASRDAMLRQARSRLLRSAGYTTIRIDDIALACSMARFGAIGTVIVDWTFTPEQQTALIYSLKQMMCRVHIVCVRHELKDTRRLLDLCARCDNEQGNDADCVHVLQDAVAPVRANVDATVTPELTPKLPLTA